MADWRWKGVCGLLGLLVPSVSLACLWDYDTLQMERQRFPGALELITGKFLRHSPEFYRWRIQDRKQKLQAEPDNLSYYDDLAVAYDKTDQGPLAVETILLKDRKKPGLYETEANLGTFYIHAGQLEKGLEHIRRALEINPNAHFNREKYQAYLAEYVLAHRVDGKLTLPITTGVVGRSLADDRPPDDFLSFLESKLKQKPLPLAERQAAIQGVLGIMRFGKHDSPLLLEVLANLLTRGFDSPSEDAKQLAARAYLRASYEAPDEAGKVAYRDLAARALSMQVSNPLTHDQLSLQGLEQAFQNELAEARAWYDAVKQNELKWVQEGTDADEAFRKTYYNEPVVGPSTWKDGFLAQPVSSLSLLAVGLVGPAAVAAVLFWHWRGRRLARSTT